MKNTNFIAHIKRFCTSIELLWKVRQSLTIADIGHTSVQKLKWLHDTKDINSKIYNIKHDLRCQLIATI